MILTQFESGLVYFLEGGVGLYQIALDGSGTLGTHQAVSYAGIVGTQLQILALSEEWSLVIKANGLEYFKMAEAATFYGEFEKKMGAWGDNRVDRRDALLLQLASLIKRYDLRVVGGAAGMAHFTEKSAAENKMRLFKFTVSKFLKWIPDGHTAILHCDIEHDVEHRYRAWIDSLKRDDSSASKIIGVCFTDDKAAPCIQAADMVAWLVRQEVERVVANQVESQINALYEMLMSGSNVDLRMIPEEKFFD